MDEDRSSSLKVLIPGDLIAILLITLTGFATHGEISAVARMLSTFIPLCAGWGLAACMAGLYRPGIARDLSQWWRPAIAALLGVPLAAWLRGGWLNAPILPIFVLVLVTSVALLMTVWRVAWMFSQRKQVQNG